MSRTLIVLLVIQSIFLPTLLSGQLFQIRSNDKNGTIEVFKAEVSDPVITQNAREGSRPYLHPVRTPDGKGVLTEIHPSHHLHQTGIYWGLKKVNGRDYFMNLSGDYYQYRSSMVLNKTGETVSWETVYDLLNENGDAILRETQTWSLREKGSLLLLDLEWQGKGLVDVTIEKFFVGGLFMRMPWTEGIAGEAINALGEKNSREAESHRALWVDVGMEIAGINEWGHIAILDHPDNQAFPSPWRVDRQLGVGPSRQILGDWHLAEGEAAREKYRLVIYTGKLERDKLAKLWTDFASETRN